MKIETRKCVHGCHIVKTGVNHAILLNINISFIIITR